MRLGRLGLWSVELRTGDPGQIRDAAAELDELGYGTLWIPGLGGGDVTGDSARLLAATRSVTVATGVINIWRHDPARTAADHRLLGARYGHRSVLGLGVGDADAASAAGQPFRPLTQLRTYLDRLDQAETPVPPGERMLAAMGPKLTELAAGRAAGVHPFLVTPEATAHSRGLLGAGPLLAPYQAVVLERDPARARAAARGFLGMFLGLDHYARSLRRQGFTDGDLAGGGSDRLIDAMVARGDVAAVERRVRAHHDAGADHVCLHVLGGGGMPRRQWRELAALIH